MTDDASIRGRLLRSALALAEHEDIDALSIDRIRAAAGVSNGSFFHAFRSKADLFAQLYVQCVEQYQSQVIEALEASHEGREGVERFVAAHLDFVESDPVRARLMFEQARASWFAPVAPRLQDMNARFVARVDAWRAPRVMAGELEPVSAAVFIATLVAPANMLYRLRLAATAPEAEPPSSMADELSQVAVRALVRGTADGRQAADRPLSASPTQTRPGAGQADALASRFTLHSSEESIMTRDLAAARQALNAQPFSRLLGAELTRFDADRVAMRVPGQEALRQQHGFFHGGVLSYVADNLLTFAGGSALGPAVVTSEFKINYVKPAIGNEIQAEAWVVACGKTQAVCRCDVFFLADGERHLCAVAQGTISRLSDRR